MKVKLSKGKRGQQEGWVRKKPVESHRVMCSVYNVHSRVCLCNTTASTMNTYKVNCILLHIHKKVMYIDGRIFTAVNRKKILPCVTTWIDPGDITL